MKISLALGPRQVLSRQTAWGCLTSNMALPGSGSLVAGRISGYAQLALALVGLVLSLVLTLRSGIWMLANWSRLHDPYADPLDMWYQMWLCLRWPLGAILLFACGWLWGLGTGLQLVQEAKAAERKQVPPKLG